jgi:hypothetical protein
MLTYLAVVDHAWLSQIEVDLRRRHLGIIDGYQCLFLPEIFADSSSW